MIRMREIYENEVKRENNYSLEFLKYSLFNLDI